MTNTYNATEIVKQYIKARQEAQRLEDIMKLIPFMGIDMSILIEQPEPAKETEKEVRAYLLADTHFQAMELVKELNLKGVNPIGVHSRWRLDGISPDVIYDCRNRTKNNEDYNLALYSTCHRYKTRIFELKKEQ